MQKMIWTQYLDSYHFSDRFMHIICRILIYGFKYMNLYILFVEFRKGPLVPVRNTDRN